MGAYAAEFNRTAGTAVTLGTVTADATRPRRLALFEMNIGSEATPADAALKWVIQRCTAPGTATAVTPRPLDPADAATEADAGENHTVEPTYTANVILFALPLNQRATFRWIASERGRIITPATADNGFGIHTPVISTGTPAITATVHVEEQ